MRRLRIEESTGGDGAAKPACLRSAKPPTCSPFRRGKFTENLVAEGKLPHYQIDNAIRVAKADVEDYLAECRVSRQPLVVERRGSYFEDEEAPCRPVGHQDFPLDDWTKAAFSAASRRRWDFWAKRP